VVKEAMGDRSGLSYPRRGWVPFAVFLGVVITQFAWIWGTPPFRGIDEIDHAFRAASVAIGDVRPTRLPAEGRGTLVEVPPGLVADAQAQCRTLKYNGASNCYPEKNLADGNVLVASSAAPYSPVFYAVIGAIAKPWDGVTSLYVMRTSASVINALLLALAAWCLLFGSRTGWPIAGLVAGLTPMAIYTTMLPAPNGVELASATLLWCALLGFQRGTPEAHRKTLALAALACGILGSVRSSGPLFIFLITAFVAMSAPRDGWRLARQHWKGIGVVSVAGLVGAGYQADWLLHHPPTVPLQNRVPFDLGLVLQQVVMWVFQWIGAMPLRNDPSSPLTYAAYLMVFAILGVLGWRRGDTARWVAGAVVAASLVMPFLYTLVTFSQKGLFWQGRYALPLLMGAPILLGVALDRPGLPSLAAQRAIAILSFAGSSAAVIHAVNLELKRPVSATDPHWHPPTLYATLALALAAAVAFNRAVAWAQQADRRTTPRTALSAKDSSSGDRSSQIARDLEGRGR
jgi:hypothetical protein